MCPTRTTCDIIVCSNPKAINPNTGELVFLAREDSTGKLIWVQATDKIHPPPNQIISRATDDGQIPPGLLAKLKESSGQRDCSPVFLIQGNKVQTSFPGSPKTKSPPVVETNVPAKKAKTKESETSSVPTSPKVPKSPENEPSSQETKKSPASRQGSRSRSPAKSRSKRKRRDNSALRLKKPKRPKTGYNFFQLSIRDKLCQKVSMDDRVLHNETVARIIGKKWKALSKRERRFFQTLADQDKTRYERELKEYLQKMQSSELGGSDDRKQPPLRRCVSFDDAMSKNRKSKAPKSSDSIPEGSTSAKGSSSVEASGSTEVGKSDLIDKKSLGRQISEILGSFNKPLKTLKGFDDALSLNVGHEPRLLRGSLSCDNMPLSSNLFSSPVLPSCSSDVVVNDDERLLMNPLTNDLYNPSDRPPALFDATESPVFPSLPDIDSMFSKDFTSWDSGL